MAIIPEPSLWLEVRYVSHPQPPSVPLLVEFDPGADEFERFVLARRRRLDSARLDLNDNPSQTAIAGHSNNRLGDITILLKSCATEVRSELRPAFVKAGASDLATIRDDIVGGLIFKKKLHVALAVRDDHLLVECSEHRGVIADRSGRCALCQPDGCRNCPQSPDSRSPITPPYLSITLFCRTALLLLVPIHVALAL